MHQQPIAYEKWLDEPDTTAAIFEHSKRFTEKFNKLGYNFDGSERSIKEDVTSVILEISKQDRTQPGPREDESGLLSYIYATISSSFNGKCHGIFNPKNAGAAYYSLRLIVGDKVYNLSTGLSSSMDKGHDFSVYYEKLKNSFTTELHNK